MANEVVLERSDIQQQYLNCIVKYKDRIIFVSEVDALKRVRIVYLESMNEELVPFSLEHFKVAKNRIGMINKDGIVFYGERIPSRKMRIGLSADNFTCNRVLFFSTRNHYDIKAEILQLRCSELFNSLTNRFPTFSKCLDAIATGSIDGMAWDRQFAISKDRIIYYKTLKVGSLPKGATKESEIVFEKGYEYLSIVLEGNYEKTVSITCK